MAVFARISVLASLLVFAGCKQAAYVPSNWLGQVPAATRALGNPLPPTAAHVSAGRDAYGLYCVSCHGADGLGRGARPSLRTARVRGETDGEIDWILHNGSKGHGMPAWRSLGDTTLWQLIEYIRAMPPAKQ